MLDTLFCKQLIAHVIKNKKITLNEKEKMLKGQMYNPSLDYKLFIERQNCKNLCFKYNQLSPENIKERCQLISKIIGKTGLTFFIEQPFMCDYGYNIEIGENFASNHNLLILDCAKVTFGKNVMVGPNNGFFTTSHPLSANIRIKNLQWAKPITIEDNVWLGANVVVLGGVTIGKNSVIGAGSVVKKNIPPNSLAVGNPCKIIKTIKNPV